jgi:hypothetical protein
MTFFAFSVFGASPGSRDINGGTSFRSFAKWSGSTIDHFVRAADGAPALQAVEYAGLYLPAAKAERHGRTVVISAPGLPPVTLNETDGPQRLTVSTDKATLGRWFFAGDVPARVEFATGHSLNFTVHGKKVRERVTGHGAEGTKELEFDQGYGRGVYHPVILDLVAGQLGLGEDWTAQTVIRSNESGSVYTIRRSTGDAVAFAVRGGAVNVIYDVSGTPILYDIDLSEQFYPAGPDVAHVPRRILVSADGRAEWEAPQSPEGSIGSAWMPERPTHGPTSIALRMRNLGSTAAALTVHAQKHSVKPELYQICDTSYICTYWDGGSSCTTTVYYCEAGTGTGECYIFDTCSDTGGGTGCLSLGCGDSGGTVQGDSTHPNDHITRADLQSAVDSAMDGAADKLANAQCSTVLTKYTNADGTTAQQVLDRYGVSASTYLTSWIQFNDGTNYSKCTSTGSAYPIYTTPGSRSVWVCSQFVTTQRNTPGYAADLMIHEMLHSLGLGEDPPSSAEITRSVQDACGN